MRCSESKVTASEFRCVFRHFLEFQQSSKTASLNQCKSRPSFTTSPTLPPRSAKHPREYPARPSPSCILRFCSCFAEIRISINRPALLPKRPRLLPSSGGAQESWVEQFEAFRQFENRYIWDVRITLVAEDFLEKQNVLEYFSCGCFLVTPTHRDLLIHQKKGAPSFYR
jgi:hypothetical protein